MTDIDLDKLRHDGHFRVPDGYFEQLPAQVLHKIRQRRRDARRLWLPAAAASLLLIIGGIGAFNMANSSDNLMEARRRLTERQLKRQRLLEEQQLKDQMARYYSDELAQLEYFYY